MSKQRSPKRDDKVDRTRTIYWFHLLADAVGSYRAALIQRNVLNAIGYHEGLLKSGRFLTYAKGDHVPNASLIRKADQFLPGTADVIDHVLWDVLCANKDIGKHARQWIGQLSPDHQKAVLSQDAKKIEERTTTGDMLLRRFNLDSLAAFVILFRLNSIGQQTHRDQDISLVKSARGSALGIFRVLMLMGSNFPRLARDVIFTLFVEKIFNSELVMGYPAVNWESFDYSGQVDKLRLEAIKRGVAISSPLSRENLRIVREIINICQ